MRSTDCRKTICSRCGMASTAFDKTLASIFDAVLDERLAPTALEAVAGYVGAAGAAYLRSRLAKCWRWRGRGSSHATMRGNRRRRRSRAFPEERDHPAEVEEGLPSASPPVERRA